MISLKEFLVLFLMCFMTNTLYLLLTGEHPGVAAIILMGISNGMLFLYGKAQLSQRVK